MINVGSLILGALIFVPIILATVLTIFLFRRNRRGRRSPLTSNLLRAPGETLRVQIEELSEKIDGLLFKFFTAALPPIFVVWLLAYFQENKVPYWQLGVTYLFFLFLLGWAARRLYRLLTHRANLYLGLDAELAVGQELNHLMLLGCRVFHDFPAEQFNIDHILVGPGGVYAIETKGRAKPDKGRGSLDAKVICDGQSLKFPDWQERGPLEQAVRQAQWLQRWLSSGVGESVHVRPGLALPGWFVELKKQGSVSVFNGKSPTFLAKPQGSTRALSTEMIQRIAHQLEQRCRTVAPVAYRKKREFAS